MGKLKPVKIELIQRGNAAQLYGLVDTALSKWHQHLNSPHVLLWWSSSWKPDKDGHTKLACISKSSDRLKEVVEHDLCIDLNKELWNTLNPDQQLAVIDHEFCHVDLVETEDGPKLDERGRTVYRMKRHDLEEFRAVVDRHGLYLADVQAFANDIIKANNARHAEVT